MDFLFNVRGGVNFEIRIDRVKEMSKLQKWDKFTTDYGNEIEAKKTELIDIINSDQPDETKRKAVDDYGKQLRFYEWLVDKNTEVQESGTAPDTVTVPQLTSGTALYTWSTDGKTYPVQIFHPLPTQKVTGEWTFAKSQHFEIRLHYTRIPSNYRNNEMQAWAGTGFPPTTETASFGLQPVAGGSWWDYWQWQFYEIDGVFTPYTWDFNYSSSVNTYPMMAMLPLTVIPTLTPGRQTPGGSNTDGVTNRPVGGAYTTASLPTDTVNAPWDYYNTDMLPGIDRDNAVFPTGYSI